MISAYVFPGLKKPDTPLFKSIQLIISENGGAIRLAEKIENEWLKTRHFGGLKWNRKHKQKKERVFMRYSEIEDQTIIDNYKLLSATKIVALLHNRSKYSIHLRVIHLKKTGLINYYKDGHGKVLFF